MQTIVYSKSKLNKGLSARFSDAAVFGFRDHKDREVNQDLKDLEENQDHKEDLDHPVLEVKLDLLDRRVRLVVEERVDHQDHQVFEQT